MKTTLRKISGFTLIEVMISMGLVSILALVVFSLNNFMNKGKAASDMSYAADNFRKEILSLLNNPNAWRFTLDKTKNPTFTCIVPPGNCLSAVGQGPAANNFSYGSAAHKLLNTSGACVAPDCAGGFDVYGAGGTVFYPFASQIKAGYTMGGAQCQNWVGVPDASGKTDKTLTPATASQCPFRLVLYWQPICPSTGNCGVPAIHVMGYTLYTPNPKDPQSQSSFNPSQYGIDVVLPPKYQ
jgi:prepilin-type N-terminal cleavage/methylation domain-containing protein